MDEHYYAMRFDAIRSLFRHIEHDLEQLKRRSVEELDLLQARISVLERQLREANGKRNVGN